MNWKNILDDIRSDFNQFIEDGGWKQMTDDDEEGKEGEEESEDEDEDFGAEVDGAESSEDDFSDEEESYGSDSESGVSSLDESAVSWDELDRRAEQEERKNAVKRLSLIHI